MIIFPAIDIIGGKAVRLFKGEYDKKTVYGDDPAVFAADFKAQGATHIHIVDLDGAKSGNTPNFDVIKRIKEQSGLFCEVGGGIRNIITAEKYLSAGIDRVILGTAAIKNGEFLRAAVREFGDRIAVGADVKDGYIAVSGWMESSDKTLNGFLAEMQEAGVKTVICTDISKDGAMQGTNYEMYREIVGRFNIDFIASGGVSTIKDVIKLKETGLAGAIIGKAYYTGAISLSEAIKAAK